MSKVKSFLSHIRNFNGKIYANNTIYVNDTRVAVNAYEMSFIAIAAKLGLTDVQATIAILASLPCEVAKVGKYDALIFNYGTSLSSVVNTHKFIIIDKDSQYTLKVIENAVYVSCVENGSVTIISKEVPPKAEKVNLQLKQGGIVYGSILNRYTGLIISESDKRLLCVFQGNCEKGKPYHFSLSIPKAWGGGLGCMGLNNTISYTFEYFEDETMEVNFKSWSYKNLLEN